MFQQILLPKNAWGARNPRFYQEGQYIPQYFDPNGGDLHDEDLKIALEQSDRRAFAQRILNRSDIQVSGETLYDRFKAWVSLVSGHVASSNAKIAQADQALSRPAFRTIMPDEPTLGGLYSDKLPGTLDSNGDVQPEQLLKYVDRGFGNSDGRVSEDELLRMFGDPIGYEIIERLFGPKIKMNHLRWIIKRHTLKEEIRPIEERIPTGDWFLLQSNRDLSRSGRKPVTTESKADPQQVRNDLEHLYGLVKNLAEVHPPPEFLSWFTDVFSAIAMRYLSNALNDPRLESTIMEMSESRYLSPEARFYIEIIRWVFFDDPSHSLFLDESVQSMEGKSLKWGVDITAIISAMRDGDVSDKITSTKTLILEKWNQPWEDQSSFAFLYEPTQDDHIRDFGLFFERWIQFSPQHYVLNLYGAPISELRRGGLFEGIAQAYRQKNLDDDFEVAHEAKTYHEALVEFSSTGILMPPNSSFERLYDALQSIIPLNLRDEEALKNFVKCILGFGMREVAGISKNSPYETTLYRLSAQVVDEVFDRGLFDENPLKSIIYLSYRLARFADQTPLRIHRNTLELDFKNYFCSFFQFLSQSYKTWLNGNDQFLTVEMMYPHGLLNLEGPEMLGNGDVIFRDIEYQSDDYLCYMESDRLEGENQWGFKITSLDLVLGGWPYLTVSYTKQVVDHHHETVAGSRQITEPVNLFSAEDVKFHLNGSLINLQADGVQFDDDKSKIFDFNWKAKMGSDHVLHVLDKRMKQRK